MDHAWNSHSPAGWIPDGEGKHDWLKSPQRHFALIGALYPRLMVWAALFLAAGLEIAFFAAPDAPRDASLYRMIFIHVPAAWLSLALFVLMTALLVAGQGPGLRTLALLAQSVAPSGAMLALMALWTGSLWGRQSLQHWWDAGLTIELVILLLYVAIILFRFAIEDSLLADRISAIVALPGAVAIPFILASWAHWPVIEGFLHAAHGGTGSATWSAVAVCLVGLAFLLYAAATTLARLRCAILERDRRSDWVAGVRRGRA